MAFSISTLTKGGSDTDAVSYTTASITPTTGRLLIAACWTYDAGGLANFSATCTGNSLTWTAIPVQGYTNQAIQAFYAYADGTQTSGGVTFTNVVSSGTADGASWLVVQCQDAFAVTNTQGFSASNRTTNDTLTLPALSTLRATPNAVIGIFGSYDDAGGAVTFTAESGWTLHDSNSQTAGGDTMAVGLVYETDNTDTTAQATVSAANDRLVGLAFELKLIRTRTASIDGNGNFAATAFRNRSRTASIAGDGAFAASVVRVQPRSASIAGNGSFAATAFRNQPRSASVAGNGEWSAAATVTRFASASVAGNGDWNASAYISGTASVQIAGNGTWAGAAFCTRFVSAAVVAAGAWSSSSVATRFCSVAWSGNGAWSATITGGTTPVEQARFGGTPQSRRDLDRMTADARLAMILRDDEEVLLCLLT